MKRMVQIPYELEQEEDGSWGAHAVFPSGGAHGVGESPDEAVADLHQAVTLVLEEIGHPFREVVGGATNRTDPR